MHAETMQMANPPDPIISIVDPEWGRADRKACCIFPIISDPISESFP